MPLDRLETIVSALGTACERIVNLAAAPVRLHRIPIAETALAPRYLPFPRLFTSPFSGLKHAVGSSVADLKCYRGVG